MVAMDQGGGGFQAMMYMVQVAGLMGGCLFDPSHRTWNDCKQAVTDSGLWGFCLLLQVVLNLDFGPWEWKLFFLQSRRGKNQAD
eukprot:11195434-Lingulodinium_polyedra.AAC.1